VIDRDEQRHVVGDGLPSEPGRLVLQAPAADEPHRGGIARHEEARTGPTVGRAAHGNDGGKAHRLTDLTQPAGGGQHLVDLAHD